MSARTFTNKQGHPPETLTDRKQWIVWRYVANGDGKPRKVPSTPDGHNLKSWQKPGQWLGYREALIAYRDNEELAGIGFVLTKDTGIIGVDIDDAIDPDTGEIADWAQAHLDAFKGTYAEVSPSGSGLRMFALGNLPDGCRKHSGHREIYDSGRWLTLTGNIRHAEPVTTQTEAVERYLAAMRPDGEKTPQIAAEEARQGDIAGVSEQVIVDLRSALGAIRADDRELWIRMGHALHCLGDVGRGLWIDWSQTSTEWRPEDAQRWDGFKPDSINYQSVFHEAKKWGWLNTGRQAPASVNEFDEYPGVGGNTQHAEGLLQFDISGDIETMRQKMLDDVHVLGDIALLGQYTVLYAPPNSGKTLLTLWLLREAIQDGRIDGGSVFYVNCDDSYQGIVDKGDFAHGVGFRMLADGLREFKSRDLLGILQAMASNGNAHGTVVILDTLKKFVDLMDKSRQTAVNKTLRAFVQVGGTIVALAHTNKHRDAEGRSIYSGTTDTVDDADCAYTLDATGTGGAGGCAGGVCVVTFDNIKARGNVARQVRYEFDSGEGKSWIERLESVRVASDADAKRVRGRAERERVAEDNPEIVAAATRALVASCLNHRELVKFVSDETGEGRDRIRRTIKALTGTSYIEGHRWTKERGEKNAGLFHLIPNPVAEMFDRFPAHPQTQQTSKQNGQKQGKTGVGQG